METKPTVGLNEYAHKVGTCFIVPFGHHKQPKFCGDPRCAQSKNAAPRWVVSRRTVHINAGWRWLVWDRVSGEDANADGYLSEEQARAVAAKLNARDAAQSEAA